MTAIETRRIAGGHDISRMIKGGWQLAGGHGAVDASQAIADMSAFADAGITTFDCADIYTGVEEMIGAFILNYRRDRRVAAAERIRVHTKLVPDLNALATITRRQIEAIIDRSLARLNLDRLRLVQFFWWDRNLGPWLEVTDWLEAIRCAGKIESIGVTNFNTEAIAQILENGLRLTSSQVQFSLLDWRPLELHAALARKHDIAIFCYGVLAGGFLTDKWLNREDPGFQFGNRSLIKYRLIIDEFGGWPLFQDLLAALRTVADRHDCSVANVATRWMLDQPEAAAVIIGARTARDLEANLRVFELTLGNDDRVLIQSVLDCRMGPAGDVYGLESDRSGRHGRIMKYNSNDAAPRRALVR